MTDIAPALEAPAYRSRYFSRHPLAAFTIRRILTGLLGLFAVSVIVFAATQVLPGNAAVQILGRNATPQAVAQLSRELGLDRSALAQYTSWLTGLLHGNLGRSLAAQERVVTPLSRRIQIVGAIAHDLGRIFPHQSARVFEELRIFELFLRDSLIEVVGEVQHHAETGVVPLLQ